MIGHYGRFCLIQHLRLSGVLKKRRKKGARDDCQTTLSKMENI